MNTFLKTNEKKTAAAALLVLSAVFVSLVWNNNVWMDEAFTASLVHTGFMGVIERSAADTLPPLYNIILWVMTAVFGYDLTVMKITSVIPMLCTLFAGSTVVRRRFGIKTALLFMFFITFMPLMLYFGVEIRMYSLGFFFATLSGIYAYETAVEPVRKNRVLFVLFSTLAGYSHHFAFVTAAFAYLYLLIYFITKKRERIREWLMYLLETFILYLPCLIVTVFQFARVSGYFSMPEIDFKQFVLYMAYPFITGKLFATVICALVAAVPACIVVTGMIKKKATSATVFALACFSVYYGVLLFGTAVCKVMSANIFVDRYLFFSTGLLWLGAAVVLGMSDKTFPAALILTAVIGVVTYTAAFKNEYGNSADEEIEFLRENISEGDVFFSIGEHEEMQNCIPFYTYLDRDTAELTFVYPLAKAVKTANDTGRTLWISVLDGYDLAPEDRKILEDNGLFLEKQADFEFDRYKCAFYKAVHFPL